ncbi:DoxX-like family protein [Lysinibacillus sp. BPa_S21]|uniref:DoxX-like family protein n=1 Tax=Lysinibacillus sp. BPa_S21 TaxID=2932478 RepID=UPI0020130FB0|nr:DoxX-like family protein [Lysinibacillus sp. BPa_S21]MCL1694673.1 DoxX-like family protein [Lysinibacillus sp. BPa_S21]
MKKKPIYVEVDIRVPIDEAWSYTQNPKLHEQWDLRFTSITYIDKESPEEPQRFTYETKVMPGLSVSGWGESKGEHHKKGGTKTSSLHFGTPQKISPIAEGKGYWQYIPTNKGLTFLTQYDYDVRYGKLGKLFDGVFRPVMGWATALSFDVLKRWLEKGENPFSQYRRFFLTMLISVLFCFVWLYHGLVPKIIVQHPTEVMMIKELLGQLNGSGNTREIVNFIGLAEIIFALCWLLPLRKRLLFGVQILLFPCLTLGAVLADKTIATAPFNPITLNLALWVLSIIGLILSKDMPSAKSCKRKRGGTI